MLLMRVVGVSQRIAEAGKRLQKISLLSALLRELRGDEIEIVPAILSGRVRQGRIGVGYRSLQASAEAASQASIDVLELDRTLDTISQTSGAGSEQRRRDLLV